MKKDVYIYKTKKMPSLDEFKRLGTALVDMMEKPVMVSLNIRNLKYFNEMYGVEQGDQLISLLVDVFYWKNEWCVLGSMSYADHLLVLCEGGKNSKEMMMDFFHSLSERFLNETLLRYKGAKVHVECGCYVMKPGEPFIFAQDNARYARKSIQGSYATTLAWYSEDLRKASVKEASIIPNFEQAMERGDIQVYLQPKCSVSGHDIIGAEALSRFCDEEGNVLSPASYVPVLEQAGLISRLDLYVLEKVVELLANWKKKGRRLFPISVNLSSVDLEEEAFLEVMDQVVERSGVERCYIEFELTETVLVQNLDYIIGCLQKLRNMGYRIALDDFGSGYNSLYVLGQVPANVIKFDRGFVLHSISNEMGLTILSNLVNTFKEVKFEVLCEGVETEEEKEKIVSCGCDVIQGYLYDKPLVIEKFEEKYLA